MLNGAQNQWRISLALRAESYLRETFGTTVELTAANIPKLPHFLNDQYVVWTAELLGRPCLLVAPTPDADPGVDEMARHLELLREKAGRDLAVLLFEAMTPARRHALLTRRMAFITPMAQIFIPEILMDLRERTPRPPPKAAETFSPTAQLAILGSILRPVPDDPASATVLARRYGVAIMSMTRAFDELQTAGLADARRIGQHRALRFHQGGRALWDEASPRLQSPIRKVRSVVIPYPEHFAARIAGESALGLYTSLARPRRQTLAVASSAWNQLVRDAGLRETEASDPQGDFIETWSYDPGALATDSIVDRLSLYLSLRHHPDERVALTANELLESVTWS